MALRCTAVLMAAKPGKYANLSYIRHMPKKYLDKIKGTVPWRVYRNRFGAPPLTKRIGLLEEEYVYTERRPFEQKALDTNLQEQQYKIMNIASKKHYANKMPVVDRIPDEEWYIFPGDHVKVMVGEDKGKIGIVMSVIRERNWVLVEGMHTITELDEPILNVTGFRKYQRVEQPLDVSKGEVRLIDPTDEEPTEVEWAYNKDIGEWRRYLCITGRELKIPQGAYVTYEYIKPEHYIEGEKDTPADEVLKCTYRSKLMTFEQEIMQEMGIEEDRRHERTPTYWY